jgi:hypothetical protein
MDHCRSPWTSFPDQEICGRSDRMAVTQRGERQNQNHHSFTYQLFSFANA